MKILLVIFFLISFCIASCKGRQEHKELFIKKSKLTRFFQENNSSGSVSEKKKKWESKKHVSKIIIPSVNKDQEKYNASHVGNTSHVIGHNSNHSNKHVKKEKAAIWNLVCKLFNISKESEACKEKSHSKKAMIWPTKMLPWLKKVLMNKLFRGDNQMSLLDNVGNPSQIPFAGAMTDKINDNWDENPFVRLQKHRHGLKMVPLVQNLKARLFGQRQPNSVGSLNEALNGEELNGFGQGSPHLFHQILRQALGGSDRDAVLNEMRQELLLASDRGESEGNERFEDLNGRNTLAQLNNGMQSLPIMQEPSQNIGIRQPGLLNMFQRNTKAPFMEQPIHAQMLDNGVIAPMTTQAIRGLPFKSEVPISGSLMSRSSAVGDSLRMPPLPGLPINFPTTRTSQLQSTFQDAPTRGGSLLQRAGGFDLPMSASMFQGSPSPTQRMHTEPEDDAVRSMDELTTQDDNFIEQNEPVERLPPQSKQIGSNLVMEEISDNTARGKNFPLQTNPDINRLMKLHSRYRASHIQNSFRPSRYGLHLPLDSSSLGLDSVLSKYEDSANFNDLNNQRSLAFRRGKVLNGSSGSSRGHHTKQFTLKDHKKMDKMKDKQ
ncbi:uncharacterized protein [Montipora foliosa]|uniref:uncharacterized protein n=1 Tax=Montipora foliosa TaxID=591990 RepID=UPI0035F20AB5